MPKIVFISDTHSLHRFVTPPEGDILVHCGDWMNSGKDLWEAFDFSKWWNAQPHPFKILIAGNHDMMAETRPELVFPYFENTTYLQDSGTEILGLKFYGSPWTPAFMQWGFMQERGKNIRRYWDAIPNDTDILVTHGPPREKLDYARFGRGDQFGCSDLKRAVERVKPAIHAFGHIHGGYGYLPTEDTLFVNASQVDEAYNVTRKPIVVDIEKGISLEVVA